MKLLIYAAIFCFLITLIIADEDEEAETDREGEAGVEAKPAPRKQEKEEGEEGETEGEVRKESESQPRNPTATEATPQETKVKGKPPAKQGPPLTKGGKTSHRRCKILEPNINCVGASTIVMWYYNGETCVPRNVGGCSVPRNQRGYLLCGLCVHRCMGIPLHSRKIGKVCKRKA
uniref:Putative bovine pancreatic trypsin inhibitor n=1 Tax=Rhipicephalus microplus TaxID=6941 RepID=A0A6G5A5L5_RHIMP